MKKLRLIILILALVYVLWLSVLFLQFKTYKASEIQASALEIKGAYHIHTDLSDGRKSPDEIIKLAAQASLDYVLFIDHGNPNLELLSRQEWNEGILVLAGSELSTNRGHLVALDTKLSSRRFSRNAETACYEIEALEGYSIIAHPYSKASWSWGKNINISGIEIINGDSVLINKIFASIPYLPSLLIEPRYGLLKMLDRPEKNLRKWDELNRIHPVFGYFATDAHLLYRPLIDLFHIHIILKKPFSSDFETAKRQVFDALKEGRFYNSINAAARADGFRFWAEKDNTIFPMGKTIMLDSPVTLHIKTPFSFAKNIHLLLNGKSIFQSYEGLVLHEVERSGVYRVEVYLKERSPLKKNIPWIASNPIFIREVGR
ncbi:hypothetical protein ACFLRM_01520 [Acidobacteriota bacterium]